MLEASPYWQAHRAVARDFAFLLEEKERESLNRKIRVITRRAYGFLCAHALISLIFLCHRIVRVALTA